MTRDDAAADQRRRILEATAELVGTQGYHEATIETISRRARVGYATFYKHYEDKEAAFLALLDIGMEQVAARAEEAYERAGDPWTARVEASLRVLFDVATAHPPSARAVLVEATGAGPEAAAKYEAALVRIAPMLLPGRELAPHRADLPENLEQVLVGGVAWVLGQRLLAGEIEELPDLFPELFEFVLRPYLGEDAAAREAASIAA